MITVDKAKLIIEKYINILDIEKIELKNSENRVLAMDILANFPSPLFDNSAMDGFAVRSSDLLGAKHSSPIELELIGISSAGSPTDIIVRKGQCVQCMTGAKIPEGADSIIMVENTSGFDNNFVQFFSETLIGNNIRRKGEEMVGADRKDPGRWCTAQRRSLEAGRCLAVGGSTHVSPPRASDAEPDLQVCARAWRVCQSCLCCRHTGRQVKRRATEVDAELRIALCWWREVFGLRLWCVAYL